MMSVTAVEKPSVPWPGAKVEIWPIERLTTNPRNARIHGPEQIEQIRASLREFGWTMPVLVRENGILIAGHGRLEAATLEGIKEVPTIVARGWSEAQCQAYAIADNRLTDSSHWSEELLRLELGDLQTAGFDLALTGFDQDELNRLLVVERELDDGLDDAPEPPAEPISKPGDLWICGEHRVLCGDARVLADVEKVLGGELADMCFTDSPYNVNYSNSTKDKKRGKSRPIMNDALGKEFAAFLYDACVNILTVTKGAVYMCMSSSELDTLQKAFREAGGKWSTFVIWAKNTFTLGRVDGFDQDEAEGERDEGTVIARSFLATKGDALEALEFADGLLDARPRFVEDFREESGSVGCSRAMRNDRTNAALAGAVAIGFGVVTFVGDGGARQNIGSDVEQEFEVAAVAGFAPGQMEGERQAVEVDLEVDFG